MQLPARPTHEITATSDILHPSSADEPPLNTPKTDVEQAPLLLHDALPEAEAVPHLRPTITTTQSHKRSPTTPVVPVLPNLPSFGKTSPAQSKPRTTPSLSDVSEPAPNNTETSNNGEVQTDSETVNVPTATSEPAAQQSAPRGPPKSWAELLRNKNAALNGTTNTPSGQVPFIDGVLVPKIATVADVLSAYNVESDEKLIFLEPRGLVNTGNMCYMNSVSV